MIVLPEIATKLQEILNAPGSPIDLEMKVETPGFHITSVVNRDSGKNFIPVFISTLGGTNNPVPILKQAEGTIPVVFYYPVRYKDRFFALTEYLNEMLVGKTIHWGDISGDILTNVSLPKYGEIQDLDMLTKFRSWTAANFNREIEVMEPYGTMELTIYLSSVGQEFIYGNNVKLKKIKVSYKGSQILEDDEPVSIERVDLTTSEPAAQQTFEDLCAKGFPANAAYTKQLPLILKNRPGYYELLDTIENGKDIQNIVVELTEELPISKWVQVDGQWVIDENHKTITTTNTYYVSNYSRKTALGQLLGISLTLATLREEEEE